MSDKYAHRSHVVAVRNNNWSTDLYIDTKTFRVPDNVALDLIAELAAKLAVNQ